MMGDHDEVDESESGEESMPPPTPSSSNQDEEMGQSAFLSLQSATLLLATSSATQRRLITWVERWSRMINTEPTPAEVNALRNPELTLSSRMAHDLMKVAQFFGRPRGCNANAKRALQELANDGRSLSGGVTLVNTVSFSLCKHLLVASRAGPSMDETARVLGCSCLAETYFRPFGCTHTNVQLFNNYLSNASLCGHCSTCMRCGKLLGLLVITYLNDMQ